MDNLSDREIENIRKYKIEVTELENVISVLKNTLETFSIKLAEVEERIS